MSLALFCLGKKEGVRTSAFVDQLEETSSIKFSLARGTLVGKRAEKMMAVCKDLQHAVLIFRDHGVVAAPFGAYFAKRLQPSILLFAVSAVLIATSVFSIVKALS